MLVFNLSRFSLKTAAVPKDIIANLKITDPHLKSFIYKYENEVPWDKVNSQETLNEFINNSLNDLKQKIDPLSENSNYLKDIDLQREFEMNREIPHVAAAERVFQSDPEAAKKMILSPINKEKHNSFMAWWNYINETYKSIPAFIYCTLKPVINSSTNKDKAGPTTVNSEAISILFEKVRNNPELNYLKEYKTTVAEVDVRGSNVDLTVGGWINIPSKINDEKNFSSNVEKLKRWSSGRGWCTAAGMAEPYLSKGDFWLFINNGVADVAIRLEGDQPVEIQGVNNTSPALFYSEINGLFKEENWNKDAVYEDLKKLEKVKKLNDELETNPDILDAKLKENADTWNSLYIKNRTPKNTQILKKHLLEIESLYMFSINSIDPRDSEVIKLFESDPEIGKKMGEMGASIKFFIKNPSFIDARKKTYLKTFENGYFSNPNDSTFKHFMLDPKFIDDLKIVFDKNPMSAIGYDGNIFPVFAQDEDFKKRITNSVIQNGEQLIIENPSRAQVINKWCNFTKDEVDVMTISEPSLFRIHPENYKKIPIDKRTPKMFSNAASGFIQTIQHYNSLVTRLWDTLDDSLQIDKQVFYAASIAFARHSHSQAGWRNKSIVVPTVISSSPIFVQELARLASAQNWPDRTKQLLLDHGISPPQKTPAPIVPLNQPQQLATAKTWWKKLRIAQQINRHAMSKKRQISC